MALPTIVTPALHKVAIHTKALRQDDAQSFPTLSGSATLSGSPFTAISFEVSATDASVIFVKNSAPQTVDKTVIVTIKATGVLGDIKSDTVNVTLQSQLETLKSFALLAADAPEPI